MILTLCLLFVLAVMCVFLFVVPVSFRCLCFVCLSLVFGACWCYYAYCCFLIVVLGMFSFVVACLFVFVLLTLPLVFVVCWC